MKLTSGAFRNNEQIPVIYTCDGNGINPPLDIEDIPAGTKSLVLIVEDPDAPAGTFVHWIVFNIPVIGTIEENSVPGTQGLNTAGDASWFPPCPPSGQHRYVFTCFALDGILALKQGAHRTELQRAIAGNTIASAQLVGIYGHRH